MNLLMKKNLCVSAVSCLLTETKKWASFVHLDFFLSALSFFFFAFRDGALFICCVDSSRSACHQGVFGNCHQGISLHVGKLDGLVCRVHRLGATLPCRSTCNTVYHSDVSTLADQHLWTPAFLPLCWRIWPRQHCHTSTIRVTALKSVIPWLPMSQFF